jgi:hypothetical protein
LLSLAPPVQQPNKSTKSVKIIAEFINKLNTSAKLKIKVSLTVTQVSKDHGRIYSNP